MQHYGFVYVDLGHYVPGQTEMVVDLRRVCPVGYVDTDEDEVVELLERLGVDQNIRTPLSTFMSHAQKNPSASRGANPSSYLTADYQLLVVLTVGTQSKSVNYGVLKNERDAPAEWMRRSQDLEVFCAQFTEALDLAAANPELQINTSLVFISDKGATIQP